MLKNEKLSKIEIVKKRRVNKSKIILVVICSIVIYLILGALLPFVKMKEVSETYKKSFNKSIYYGEKEKFSPDRAAIVEASQDALDIRIKMINEAKENIVLATFDIREGKSTDDIFSAILAAADRGVKVKILVDGMYGGLHMTGVPMFYGIGTHSNIEIRFYNTPNLLKPWTVNGRMHDKYVITDNKLLLLGGRNTFDYFLGEYNQKNLSYDRDILVYNTEYDLLVKTSGKSEITMGSSVIYEVTDYFEDIWNSEYCKTVFHKESKKSDAKVQESIEEMNAHYQALMEKHPELMEENTDYTKDTVPVHKITLMSNPTHILAKEPLVWYQVQQFMKEAKERTIIHTPYAAFSRDMYEGMTEIAANNLQFEILLNSTAVGDNFMASSDYTMHRKKILKTGVDIYEFQGSHSSHGKSVLVDHDISMIGSYNLDMRSTYVDTETLLVVHGEEFNQLLEEKITDIKESSLKVSMDETYEKKENVEPVPLPKEKKILFRITSVIFQLFRYLV